MNSTNLEKFKNLQRRLRSEAGKEKRSISIYYGQSRWDMAQKEDLKYLIYHSAKLNELLCNGYVLDFEEHITPGSELRPSKTYHFQIIPYRVGQSLVKKYVLHEYKILFRGKYITPKQLIEQVRTGVSWEELMLENINFILDKGPPDINNVWNRIGRMYRGSWKWNECIIHGKKAKDLEYDNFTGLPDIDTIKTHFKPNSETLGSKWGTSTNQQRKSLRTQENTLKTQKTMWGTKSKHGGKYKGRQKILWVNLPIPSTYIRGVYKSMEKEKAIAHLKSIQDLKEAYLKEYNIRFIRVEPKKEWQPHPAHHRDMEKFKASCLTRVEYDKHRGENLNLSKFSGVNRKQRRANSRIRTQKPYSRFVTITYNEPSSKFREVKRLIPIVYTIVEETISKHGYRLKKWKKVMLGYREVIVRIPNPIDPKTKKPYVKKRKTIHCLNYTPYMQRTIADNKVKLETISKIRKELIKQKEQETIKKAREKLNT